MRRWPEWNAGVERIEMDEPFVAGSCFTMTVPDQPPLRSRLVDVRENESFTDETFVGDLQVTVQHRIERLDGGRARVTFAVGAVGPGAAQIGPAISADFPDVLAALAARAEGDLLRRGAA